MHPSDGGAPAGSSASGRYGEAVFPPGRAGEDERIDLGALTYDDTTIARLRELGAGPGWSCLDVGAGTGSVARRLLGELGVTRVLAVDRDTRFLATHPEPGLDVLEADLTDPGFDPGRFHLVHARFVLMHLPARQRLMAALAELLVPGGVLVLSDAFDPATDTAPPSPYTRAVQAMWQGLHDTIGTDVSWTPRYPQLLQGVGLEAVAAEIHVPPLVPGSAISRFWAQTWDRAREAMTATGLVDEADIDAALRYLDSPDCAALSPGMITAWGHRPEPAPGT
ncbi:class I SAM-dependent methyltransferase [Streptomyces sp. NBC_00539]|uniref:class I SAM-dependent methyltransferase n=1 Tax=Streptomyces sp. NBC_00539 TaxID=2975770 RepID=UPI002E80D8F9|nr:methyltransferase domain-containing protein [Streptomyces sp. NBC_00539]WUC63594.1 methyltransferase domain-containing protein [Streptomyces sp. NBC_00539]